MLPGPSEHPPQPHEMGGGDCQWHENHPLGSAFCSHKNGHSGVASWPCGTTIGSLLSSSACTEPCREHRGGGPGAAGQASMDTVIWGKTFWGAGTCLEGSKGVVPRKGEKCHGFFIKTAKDMHMINNCHLWTLCGSNLKTIQPGSSQKYRSLWNNPWVGLSRAELQEKLQSWTLFTYSEDKLSEGQLTQINGQILDWAIFLTIMSSPPANSRLAGSL